MLALIIAVASATSAASHGWQRLQLELKQQGIDVSHFYPVVRGRLVEINDMPVQQVRFIRYILLLIQ
jgi:predicted lysophospholipase L1 biosynthesis ABC-type transport system permease subunit